MNKEKELALQMRLEQLRHNTALINNKMYNNRFVEAGYGCKAEMLYEGTIKILSISDEQETNPKEGFEHLKTETRTIKFVPDLMKVSRNFTKNIFKSRHDIAYDEIEEIAESIDAVTGMPEKQWDGELTIYRCTTDTFFEFDVSDGKGGTKKQKHNQFTIVLFKDESLETEVRRELRNRQFVGKNLEHADSIPVSSESGS